ncbi:MAG: DUF1464 family protein, partial [Candidatus Hodarchaeales archaeon]
GLAEMGKRLNILIISGQSSAAARGSALCVNGLMGGKFSQLVEHVELSRASGSVLDMVHHSLRYD